MNEEKEKILISCQLDGVELSEEEKKYLRKRRARKTASSKEIVMEGTQVSSIEELFFDDEKNGRLLTKLSNSLIDHAKRIIEEGTEENHQKVLKQLQKYGYKLTFNGSSKNTRSNGLEISIDYHAMQELLKDSSTAKGDIAKKDLQISPHFYLDRYLYSCKYFAVDEIGYLVQGPSGTLTLLVKNATFLHATLNKADTMFDINVEVRNGQCTYSTRYDSFFRCLFPVEECGREPLTSDAWSAYFIDKNNPKALTTKQLKKEILSQSIDFVQERLAARQLQTNQCKRALKIIRRDGLKTIMKFEKEKK